MVRMMPRVTTVTVAARTTLPATTTVAAADKLFQPVPGSRSSGRAS
jgi:hypothetical protein